MPRAANHICKALAPAPFVQQRRVPCLLTAVHMHPAPQCSRVVLAPHVVCVVCHVACIEPNCSQHQQEGVRPLATPAAAPTAQAGECTLSRPQFLLVEVGRRPRSPTATRAVLRSAGISCSSTRCLRQCQNRQNTCSAPLTNMMQGTHA